MERYRPIVDDWEAFRTALMQPQPFALRVNRLRTTAQELRTRLAQRGIHLRAYSWYPDLLVAEASQPSPSRTLEHWLGYFYMQEAAAAVPVLALDPQPGEAVLDLCAAPGGKTTQIAERIGDRGLVVGNDVSAGRLRALLSNVYRIGATSIAVTAYDGITWPLGPRFDRVLVDAPCSAEGNARRSARAARATDARRLRRLAGRQGALLRRGLLLTRPGGVLVYATCTFAPEENEAVIDAVLRAAGGAVAVEELPPGLPGVPGVTSWQGQRYDASLHRCRRIYPHHLDSGGMFIARLRRLGELPWEEPIHRPEPLRPDAERKRQVMDWFETRFGVPRSDLEAFHAYEQGGDIWLSRLEGVPGWSGLQAVGIRVLRGGGQTWKPTSIGLMHFARRARRNVVDLDAEALRALLEGRRVAPGQADLDRGYVILRHHGEVLGCGVHDGHLLRSAIPQGRAEELLACLVGHGEAQ